MVEKEKKGKTEIQKFEYIKNKKSFLDEIKSIFHNHLWLSFEEKNEKKSTQALK